MVDFRHVVEAQERIAPYIHRTPVLRSSYLDQLLHSSLFFKCENLQKVGAFKARGACNAIFQLTPDQSRNGVCTHSSGNHAQALAYAARLRSIPCTIVMPHTAPLVKQKAVRGYGARIEFCEPTLEARELTLQKVVTDTGAHVVLPFNDERVIAGQGTAALELLRECPDLELVIAPVGGGGLLSGTLLAVKGTNPGILVYGAEPATADDALRSIRAGSIQPSLNPKTLADGLLTSLGSLTFPIIHEHVSDILLATETGIVAAMRTLMERMKIVVEPSGAVPLAALMENGSIVNGKRVGIIISGGNVALNSLPFTD